MSTILQKSENYFVTGLNTSDLRDLYKAIKKELKSRNQFDDRNELFLRDIKNYKGSVYDDLGIIQNYSSNITNRIIFEDYIVHPKFLNPIIFDLLKENWSFLYSGDFDKEKRYYVYYHSNPLNKNMTFTNDNGEFLKFLGMPFYIGKGTNNRYKSMKQRNTSHIRRVKSLTDKGVDESKIFNIFKDNLDEIQAIELESKLITFFGCYGERNPHIKYFIPQCGGLLLNSDISKRPVWIASLIDSIENKNRGIL